MTKEEQQALYGCSIQGYLKYFKESNYKDANEAIVGSIKYLLRSGIDDELTDCSRNELIYVIKNEIAKMVARKQLNTDPNDLTNMHSKSNKDVQSFLKNPFGYIAIELNQNKEQYKIDRMGITDDDEDRLARKYNSNIINIGRMFNIEGVKTVYNAFENNQKDNKSYHMINQLESSLPNNSIDEAFERQKPSFFEKFFRTTSNEYNQFKEAFNNYRDKNNPYCGNDNYLKENALGYIRHKFSNLKDNELPDEALIAKLSGAGKERVMFCLNVIKTINENSAIQEQANNIGDALKNFEIKEDENILDDNFKNNLKEDVNDIKNDNEIDALDLNVEIKENELNNN